MATIYQDVYSSITRRRLQEEKDAAEAAKPVRLYPRTLLDNPSGPFLKLRPVLERALAVMPRHRSLDEQIARSARKSCRRGLLTKAQARSIIATVLPKPSTFVFPAEPKSVVQRRTRYNTRLDGRYRRAVAGEP